MFCYLFIIWYDIMFFQIWYFNKALFRFMSLTQGCDTLQFQMQGESVCVDDRLDYIRLD